MTSIQHCIDKASETPYIKGQTRHYCVVLDKKGRIVGEGRNSYSRSHPLMKKASERVGLQKECIHAELAALLSDVRRKGVKLIISRVDSKGVPAYSEPCCTCKYIIREYFPNIKSVEYSI